MIKVIDLSHQEAVCALTFGLLYGERGKVSKISYHPFDSQLEACILLPCT
jgi:hypothetical protein